MRRSQERLLKDQNKILSDTFLEVARLLRIDVKFSPSVNGNCSKGIFTRKSPFSRPRSLAETGQHPLFYLLYAVRTNRRSLQDFARREQV